MTKNNALNPKKRCEWCLKDELYVKYHDEEWGVPCHDDNLLFEYLFLETFQAGLSWHTILKKRENFRLAFDQFDARKIANYDESKVKSLMSNVGIIRNQAKILAAINNAQKILEVQSIFGSFDSYVWKFTNYQTLFIEIHTKDDIKTRIPESDMMSKDMKSHGFKFIGSVSCMAYMESIGMVRDHYSYCWRNSLD